MRIGIDLGGTKIAGVVLDDAGDAVYSERVATPRGDCDAIVRAVTAMALGLERDAGATCHIGIGTPGAMSPATGLWRNSNTTCLNGQPLRALFEAALGREVRVANDANCFALSEAVDGAGAGAHVVFGIILGTGAGGGLVVGQRLVVGRHGIAGEWGHNPLPWPDADDEPQPPCYCGKSGCLETFVSGPGMALDHRKHTGKELAASAIADRARTGDRDAQATLARHARRVARGLASVINVIDPDVIVVGGGLSQMPELYRLVPPLLERWVFSDSVSTPVVAPLHGDASGVRGAAWLADSGRTAVLDAARPGVFDDRSSSRARKDT